MEDKNIIQTHKSYEALGLFEKVCVERWRVENPGWNYIFLGNHDMDEYVADTWPEHADHYMGLTGVHRSQFIRMTAVHRFGGFYADCDCYPMRPLKDFVDLSQDRFWFELLNRDGNGVPLVADYLFGADKEHPRMTEIIQASFHGSKTMAEEAKTQGLAWYMYSACGIHTFSDIVVKKYNDPRILGCGGARLCQIEPEPDRWHVFHYSVESWIPNNRFERDSVDPVGDQVWSLNKIKEIYGI